MLLPELLSLAAEEADNGPDIGKLIGQFTQYGIVGVVVVLLILGVIVPKYVMSNLTADRDKRRERSRRNARPTSSPANTSPRPRSAGTPPPSRAGLSPRCSKDSDTTPNSPGAPEMWLFSRQPQVSPEAESAMRAAEKSLQQAQAHQPEVEAQLTESRRVTEQLQAHNKANRYSGWIESLVLGRLTGG